MLKSAQVGVGVLIFKAEQLLLGKRIKNHGAYTWGPPGGHLEFGESFAACAQREVKEETGLSIETPVFVGVTNDIFLTEQKHYVSIFLKANCPLEQAPFNCEPEKVSAWEWFAWNALPEPLFLPLRHFVEENNSQFLRQLAVSV